MRESDFGPDTPGKLVPITIQEYASGLPGKPVNTKILAFVPDSLPPKLEWDSLRLKLFTPYTEIVSVLGKVNGLHKRVGNAASLLRTLWMREAKLSSQIEDIEAGRPQRHSKAGTPRNVGRIHGQRT